MDAHVALLGHVFCALSLVGFFRLIFLIIDKLVLFRSRSAIDYVCHDECGTGRTMQDVFGWESLMKVAAALESKLEGPRPIY